ncbi:MAG: hypothetical protein KF706_09940 [Chitinophagales bacterium]|mgnify:FL=1|nr:hypothetical protein [Chitinophagales bacterium]HRN95157.1 hypothetical protein [Chitinophagales bacterium]HRP39623.1 hypothetical protein [Chitinophagales bacterium]
MTFKGVKGRAIALAWPDTTARGDETWMLLLKKAGLVKNLNFKVGHAAIILVEDGSGDLFYFDFGRYVTARGMGRTRSALSDPKLVLHTKAKVNANGSILNLQEIATELDNLKHCTHGKGRIFFSVSDTLDFRKALAFANKMVIKGSMPYGALAYKNNSCSRFVAQVLVAGLQQQHPAVRKIILPESLMPSPISNVVNAQHHGEVYCYHQGTMEEVSMSRVQSLKFLISQLTDNLQHSTSRELPSDNIAGSINEPMRPSDLPHDAQWLGGIGEGAWFRLQRINHSLTATRYMENGIIDFCFQCQSNEELNSNLPYHFVYDSHHIFVTISQNGNKIKLLNSDLI